MTDFITDAWYAAATCTSLAPGPLHCTLLGQPLVLWRAESGQASALLDRCPHRHAPLSQGRVCADTLACVYHGLRFDSAGRCAHAPGQSRIPSTAAVRCFPVIERYGLVFVWMGEPALADPAELVDIPAYGQPDWGFTHGQTLFQARWTLIADNLIDPAHTSFVHQRTIGNGAGDDVPVRATELPDGTVCCERWIEAAPPVPIMQRFGGLQGLVDRWQRYHFRAPATSWVDFGALPAGSPRTPEAIAAAPYRSMSYAFLSPRDASSTHYFSLQLRHFAPEDAAVGAELAAQYALTFEEDRVLLEAIERERQRDPQAVETLMASDAGVVRLRRQLSQWRRRRALQPPP